MSGLMDTIGILTSLALQYGVPVEALVRKLEHQKFEPSGWTPNPAIGEASSAVDYVFRWIGQTFGSQGGTPEAATPPRSERPLCNG